MKSGHYSFSVGNFKCMAISDGAHTYAPPLFPPPAVFLFANAPANELETRLLAHDIVREQWTAWISPYICLLIDTGKELVLVDTGANGLADTTGKLRQNLQAVRIKPENIDLVILTHAHPDHIGGNTLDDGQLAFPNARYAMWKKEWEFWTSEEAAEQLEEHSRDVLLGYTSKNLPPIRERLELIDQEREIVPGIMALSAPGHTPGHMALIISSAGEHLLHLVDTVLHPIHISQPGWVSVIDFAPEEVISSRLRLLKLAAEKKSLVLAFHFPFPGLGHVLQNGEERTWLPIESTG